MLGCVCSKTFIVILCVFFEISVGQKLKCFRFYQMYITLLTILQAEGGSTYAFIKIPKMFIVDHHKEIYKIVHPRVSVQQVSDFGLLLCQHGSPSYNVKIIITGYLDESLF